MQEINKMEDDLLIAKLEDKAMQNIKEDEIIKFIEIAEKMSKNLEDK